MDGTRTDRAFLVLVIFYVQVDIDFNFLILSVIILTITQIQFIYSFNKCVFRIHFVLYTVTDAGNYNNGQDITIFLKT